MADLIMVGVFTLVFVVTLVLLRKRSAPSTRPDYTSHDRSDYRYHSRGTPSRRYASGNVTPGDTYPVFFGGGDYHGGGGSCSGGGGGCSGGGDGGGGGGD